jgi:hypothetical protein
LDEALTLTSHPDIHRVTGHAHEESDLIDPDSERTRRFDALFGEHIGSIASYCRWRSSSDHEDAVAEVFLIAWRRLDDVPLGDATRAWLYAVARCWRIRLALKPGVRASPPSWALKQPPSQATRLRSRFMLRRRWPPSPPATARCCCWLSGKA